MVNRFVEKLRGFAPLTNQDVMLLEEVTKVVRPVSAGHDLIREGDRPDPVFVILEGWACRYKLLPEGGRQIVAFLMPGDTCDIHVSVLAEMDHNIQVLTDARVSTIGRADMDRLLHERPQISRALWSAQLVDEGTLRAWIVSMGRRDSAGRVAHLMCELYIRARNIGLIADGELLLPLTQIVLADAVGLTPVHVNRVLRKLRPTGGIIIRRGSIVISDPVVLARVAGFDENYLHRRLRNAA